MVATRTQVPWSKEDLEKIPGLFDRSVPLVRQKTPPPRPAEDFEFPLDVIAPMFHGEFHQGSSFLRLPFPDQF